MNTGKEPLLTGADLLSNQELDRRLCEAMSQKDIDQVMSCFWDSPGLILVGFGGDVIRGPANVRKFIEGMFAQSESLRLVINEISYVPAGNGVLAVGTATYEMQAKDGSAQQMTERWTDARVKVDGRWVYALDHVHLLVPPAP